MPRPRTCNKFSARSAENYEREIEVRSDSNSNCSDSAGSGSDEDSAVPNDGSGGGIVKSLLGSGIEDAVLRTLEFGKSFIQKTDDKEKRPKRETDNEIAGNEKEGAVKNGSAGEGDGEPDGRTSRKNFQEGRSARKRVAFAAKPDKDMPLLGESGPGAKRLTNVSKIRSLDSDLKQGSPSPEKIKRQLEALIQINKDEPSQHVGHWGPFLKGPNRQVEVTVMPSLYVCRNEVNLGYASTSPQNMSTDPPEEQGSTSRRPCRSRTQFSRPSLRGLGKHAPELLSSALGPTIDVSIINNLKMIRDLLTGGRDKQDPNCRDSVARPSDRGDVDGTGNLSNNPNENYYTQIQDVQNASNTAATFENRQQDPNQSLNSKIHSGPCLTSEEKSAGPMSKESGSCPSKKCAKDKQYEFQVQSVHQNPMDTAKSIRDLQDARHNKPILKESSARQDPREAADERQESPDGFRRSKATEDSSEKETLPQIPKDKSVPKCSRERSNSHQVPKEIGAPREKVSSQAWTQPSTENAYLERESREKIVARNKKLSSRNFKDNLSLQEPSNETQTYSMFKDRRKSNENPNTKTIFTNLLGSLGKTNSKERGNSFVAPKDKSSSSENHYNLSDQKGSSFKNDQSKRNSFAKECQTPESQTLEENDEDVENLLKTKMMEWKMEELQRKIGELESKEKSLKKQIDKEEKEREKKRKFFEEEEEFMQFWKANWSSEGADKPDKFKYEKVKWETALEEERLAKLRDQSEMYKREIVAMEALQGTDVGGGRDEGSSERLKRNKSLLDAWDVIASRVCHTRLPSFSRVFDLERKCYRTTDYPVDIHCCFLSDGSQAIADIADACARKSRSRSRSRSRCKCRSRSKCGSRGRCGNQSGLGDSRSRESQRTPRRCRMRQDDQGFPMQRDIVCGLHQSLKSCACGDAPRNECITCSSEDGLLKKLGAICKKCRGQEPPCKTQKSVEKISKKPPNGKSSLCRSKSDTAVRPGFERSAKLVKVMWAVTRINIFQDDCRTYEVMDATSTPPPRPPCKTEGVFVVRNPQQKKSPTHKRPFDVPGL